MLGVELDRRSQTLFRLLRAALLKESFAKQKMADCGARLELKRRSSQLFGTLGVSLHEVQLGECDERVRGARLQAHTFFELADGTCVVAFGGKESSKPRAQSGIRRL